MARAPVFVGQRRIEWRDWAVPFPGPGELLLRCRANALCGTDLGQYRGGSAVVPGHEAAGEVVAVGEGASVAAGSLGVAYLMVYCGRCRSCRLGHTNVCLDKGGDLGFTRDGGLAPYQVVPQRCFFPTPGLDPAEATLLLDAMGTTRHALDLARQARPDLRSLALAGAGPIGLGLVVMARLLLGPQVPVLVTDVDQGRLARAAELGALTCAPDAEDMRSAAGAAGLDGLDAAIDSTGRTEARRTLLDSLTVRRGVLVCVGHGEDLLLDVSADLIAPQRAVLGSEYFPYADLTANLALLQDNRDKLASLISHRFDISRLEEALATFFGGGAGKVVVTQGEG